MKRLGIFAKTFPGTDPHTVLLAAKSSGYGCVQFNLACAGLDPVPHEVPTEVRASIKAAARQSGVSIVALSGTTNMIHPDETVRLDGRRRLAAVIAAAPDCGVRFVTLCTGSRDAQDQWRAHPDNASSAAWRDLLREMEAALDVAERHDVRLGVEPEAGNVVVDARAARRLVDELGSDRVRIVLDPANLVDGVPVDCMRDTVTAAVDLLADRIEVAHAKDRDRSGTPVAPGHGVVDFVAFFDRLSAVGFEGPVVAHGFSAVDASAVRTFLAPLLSDART